MSSLNVVKDMRAIYITLSNDFLFTILFFFVLIFLPTSQTDMDSTNLYAYISIIALIVCIPPAIIVSIIYKLGTWSFDSCDCD